LSGRIARRVMKRKIHGSERQSVVKPESAESANFVRAAVMEDISNASKIETSAAAGASRIETRVA